MKLHSAEDDTLNIKKNITVKKQSFPAYVIILLLCLLFGGTLFILLHNHMFTRWTDYRRISSEEYDTVFLSMYPIDAYSEADFQYFRAMTVFKSDYVLPDFHAFKSYMKRIGSSGNTVTTVYLGIRPDKIRFSELSSLAEAYPSCQFELIVSYPSAEYWQKLSTAAYAEICTAYSDFLTAASESGSIRTYFYTAEEWLLANPAHYVTPWSLTEDAAKIVMANSDFLHPYQITTDNVGEKVSSFRQLTSELRDTPTVYPDFSDTAIVFFGDSVIANFTDNTSIPGVISALTGATVYNCGYGGNPAAMNDKTIITLPGISAAFVARDLSAIPVETQVYRGISDYIANPPETSDLCFVISYGLNDYFNRHPLDSADPYDITTYSGALRTACETLSANFPDARIFLCTPTYTAYTSAPENTDKNYSLRDYVDTVFLLSEELNTGFVDNYFTLGISETNFTDYLTDKIHPNERGRFLIARQIINALQNNP